MDKDELRNFVNRIIEASKTGKDSFNVDKAEAHLETLMQELVLEKVPEELVDYVRNAKYFVRLYPASKLEKESEDGILRRVVEIKEEEKREAQRRMEEAYNSRRSCYGC